jgi:predicted nucleic acid-binding protein
MILDTDVLIWLLRHNVNAVSFVASIQQREISQATWLEVVEGVLNKRELAAAKAMLVDLAIRVLPLTESIGRRAGMLMEEHALKDGLDSIDSIIAATALENNLPLATANYKHFKSLGVELQILEP